MTGMFCGVRALAAPLWLVWLMCFAGAARAEDPSEPTPSLPEPEPEPEPEQVPSFAAEAAVSSEQTEPPSQGRQDPGRDDDRGSRRSEPARSDLSYEAGPPPPPGGPKAMKREGVRVHDGFYLRMSAGMGYLRASQKVGGTSKSYSGVGPSFDFGVGGTLGSGFVLGGRASGTFASNMRTDVFGPEVHVDGEMVFSAYQVFADWYVVPTSGLHIEAALGYGRLRYDLSQSNEAYIERFGEWMLKEYLDGFSGAIGIGLEGWVGEQWSIGGLVRLNFAFLSGPLGYTDPSGTDYDADRANETIRAISPLLLFTGTFH